MSEMKQVSKDRALVLFSGGQDSSTALAYALANHNTVETVGFDYGQRNRIELTCRQNVLDEIKQNFPLWAQKLGPDRVLDLSTFSALSSSALTDDSQEITVGETALPTTFVPGRNLFFFHYAAVIGYNRDLGSLVGGMCETDFSGYPDCRDQTLRLLQELLNTGMAATFEIKTPLMFASKAESWQLAQQLGGDKLIEIIRTASHTCYQGKRDTLYEWGYGCGHCPACVLRAKGFGEWQALLTKTTL